MPLHIDIIRIVSSWNHASCWRNGSSEMPPSHITRPILYPAIQRHAKSQTPSHAMQNICQAGYRSKSQEEPPERHHDPPDDVSHVKCVSLTIPPLLPPHPPVRRDALRPPSSACRPYHAAANVVVRDGVVAGGPPSDASVLMRTREPAPDLDEAPYVPSPREQRHGRGLVRAGAHGRAGSRASWSRLSAGTLRQGTQVAMTPMKSSSMLLGWVSEGPGTELKSFTYVHMERLSRARRSSPLRR